MTSVGGSQTWPRLIIRTALMPLNVALVVLSGWKPRPGSVIRLSAAWSLLMRLFRHLRSTCTISSPGKKGIHLVDDAAVCRCFIGGDGHRSINSDCLASLPKKNAGCLCHADLPHAIGSATFHQYGHGSHQHASTNLVVRGARRSVWQSLAQT